MSIPIIVFLLLYLMMVTFFILFSVFLLYHAFRFGVAHSSNIITILIYLVVSTGLLIGSYVYLAGVDWEQSIKLF